MPKVTLQLEYHAPNARQKVRVRNLTPTELDRLYHEGLITRDLWDAGEAAMRDLWKAKMMGVAARDYNGAGGGGDPQPMSSGRSRALKAVNEWISAVDKDAGRDARRVLLSVLCDDTEARGPAVILAIRHALSATMRHHENRRRQKDVAAALVDVLRA
jgi:hypothetical protein